AWFAGLVFNAVAGVYTLWLLRQKEVDRTDGEKAVEGKKLQKERNATQLQLLSDLCDLTVPSAALGYADLDDGVVGLAGTVSSLIGLYGVWKKTA
ncbi:Peroxisomal membrane protein PMP27, partial [Cryomyces antarcticus]